MPGGIESIPLAGRLMPAHAIRWILHDRPNAAPLLRFVPLQRSPAMLRCPRRPASDDPASALQQSNRAGDLSLKAAALAVALAVFRLTGSPD
jgi:hypothetical protein